MRDELDQKELFLVELERAHLQREAAFRSIFEVQVVLFLQSLLFFRALQQGTQIEAQGIPGHPPQVQARLARMVLDEGFGVAAELDDIELVVNQHCSRIELAQQETIDFPLQGPFIALSVGQRRLSLPLESEVFGLAARPVVGARLVRNIFPGVDPVFLSTAEKSWPAWPIFSEGPSTRTPPGLRA
jgi:hypothetical protein